jgi:regulation of enolase protein 1 (concanavalin A-like superfamily)
MATWWRRTSGSCGRRFIDLKSGSAIHYLNFERQSGAEKHSIKQQRAPENRALWLRLTRLGKELAGELSLDGSTWEFLGVTSLDSDGPVKVGVIAVNSTTSPHTTIFSDISFTRPTPSAVDGTLAPPPAN